MEVLHIKCHLYNDSQRKKYYNKWASACLNKSTNHLINDLKFTHFCAHKIFKVFDSS